MLKCWSFLAFTTLLIVVPFSAGHLGHDHNDHDDHKESSDDDKDSVWHSSRNISLKHETGVDLKWMDTDLEWISMKMSSRTSGYVSVGFCAKWEGTMANCDIVIGWVDDTNGTAYLHDYHAKGNAAPIPDEKQDYMLIKGTQIDGITTIEFKRKWDTEDELDDADLERNSVHIIYSWHPTDPPSFDELPPHDKNSRGHTLAAVNLRNPAVHYNDHHHHSEHNHKSSAGNLLLNPAFLLLSLAVLKFM